MTPESDAEGIPITVAWEHLPVSYHNHCLAEDATISERSQCFTALQAAVTPDVFLINHSEHSHCGWDAACEAIGTAGQVAAHFIANLVSNAKTIMPQAEIWVVSDMYDPAQNAKPLATSVWTSTGYEPYIGSSIFIKTSYAGSEEGLAGDVVVWNWNFASTDSNAHWHSRQQPFMPVWRARDDNPDATDEHISFAAWVADAAQYSEFRGACLVYWCMHSGLTAGYTQEQDFAQLDQFMDVIRLYW